MDWLNRGGPEFVQPPGMLDEEAIRGGRFLGKAGNFFSTMG
ncbi:MAG: hypothetical protein ABGZ19_00020 [Verrucomicrobiales bacterium]